MKYKKIGITFGAYCPLHQGHMDEIMRAKKENDYCFVFVCGHKGDRGGEVLPLLKRYRLVRSFLNSENVFVCMINDDDLGLDQSMSDDNWKIWLRSIYNEVLSSMVYWKGLEESDPVNITWYVGESDYVDKIVRNTSPIFKAGNNVTVEWMDRKKNPISGTICRNDPILYWDKITMPFRPYLTYKILVSGTASEGKTTLVQDIGKYFGIPYSYEKGRDNCHIKTDPEFNFQDFLYNIYEQNKYNKELIHSPQNNGVVISDTDNIVTLMYAWEYCHRDNFSINESEYQVLYNLVKENAKTIKWDKIYLIPPSTDDIVDDGERYMPDSKYSIRLRMYEFLKKTYTELGYVYKELGHDYYGNFITVRDQINVYKAKEFD